MNLPEVAAGQPLPHASVVPCFAAPDPSVESPTKEWRLRLWVVTNRHGDYFGL
jgi:hypothetical protein